MFTGSTPYGYHSQHSSYLNIFLEVTNQCSHKNQGSAHGGRRWAVPPTSWWLPPCTDLPQSSLMHAWKTYLTDNLPNCHLLRHDLYPIIIKMIIIFTRGNIFLISYVRSLYRRRACNAGSRHLQ